MPSGLI